MDAGSSGFGWLRAIVVAVLVSVMAFVLLVYLPNLIVTRWTALTHSARVAIAASGFFVALFGLARIMRALQDKGVL
jgi:hypothetical protein